MLDHGSYTDLRLSEIDLFSPFVAAASAAPTAPAPGSTSVLATIHVTIQSHGFNLYSVPSWWLCS